MSMLSRELSLSEEYVFVREFGESGAQSGLTAGWL